MKTTTRESIISRISQIEYIRAPETTVTLCTVVLDNGFTSVGESSCANPEQYNDEIEKKIARDVAVQKLFRAFVFAEMVADFHAGKVSQRFQAYSEEYSAKVKQLVWEFESNSKPLSEFTSELAALSGCMLQVLDCATAFGIGGRI